VRLALRLATLLLLATPPPVRAEDAPAPAAPVVEKKATPAAVVLAAIAKAAAENAALPVKSRLTGDALGEHYVRRAAAAATDVRSFTIGLAKALDPTDTLGKFSLTARAFRDLETADAAKARRAATGEPTIRGRNDRLLHFAVSAAITSLLGESASAAAGLAKELSDMKGTSGFSFGDLLADAAGTVFARRLSTGDAGRNLAWVAESFAGAAVLPDDAGLPDSLSQADFEKTYGGVADARFARVRERIATSVEALPYLVPAPTPPAPVEPSNPRRDPDPTR
jgi:hypothetical protein